MVSLYSVSYDFLISRISLPVSCDRALFHDNIAYAINHMVCIVFSTFVFDQNRAFTLLGDFAIRFEKENKFFQL